MSRTGNRSGFFISASVRYDGGFATTRTSMNRKRTLLLGATAAVLFAVSVYASPYRAWDRVELRWEGKDGGSFILKRHGLWSWKLAGIDMARAGR